jgi:hypothetical protein
MDKKIELAKKLKALAEQGIGGEKTNANEMLMAYMEKHGLSLDELENDQINEYDFEIDGHDDIQLFAQIAYSICGKDSNCYARNGIEGRVFSKMTYFQKVEIEMKYDFYSKLFKDELEIFYSAFIQKNRIFPEGNVTDVNDLTDEERAKVNRILEMSESITKGEVRKQIVE